MQGLIPLNLFLVLNSPQTNLAVRGTLRIHAVSLVQLRVLFVKIVCSMLMWVSLIVNTSLVKAYLHRDFWADQDQFWCLDINT